MLSTGIKTPVGIKIMGDNLDTLARVGEEIEGTVAAVQGVTSAYAERIVGGKYVDIDIDRDKIARHGLLVQDVQDVIMSALGGMNVTWTVEGQARYPVNVRYPRERRDDLSDIRRVRVPTMAGYTVPLEQLADHVVVVDQVAGSAVGIDQLGPFWIDAQVMVERGDDLVHVDRAMVGLAAVAIRGADHLAGA